MDAWTEQLNDAKGLADECFLALQQRPQAATAADLARLTAHSRRKLNALSSAVEALEEGLAGAGVSDNEAARRSDVLQGETLREQDSQLDDLSGVVTRTKTVAVAVHDELGLQARLLDDVDAELDSAQGKLGAATRKLKLLLKRSGDCKALLVLLAVIAVLVFALALAMRVAPLG